MSQQKIAIIDDDPFVISHLRSALAQRIPVSDICGFVEPLAPAGFDVYIVDKEFEGDSRGQDVIQRIRSMSPDPLILAYSAYLDQDFLRALLREGCEGAFDKGSLEELDSMIETIENHLALETKSSVAVRGVQNTIRSIHGLLREWNLRLKNNGRANAKGFGDA